MKSILSLLVVAFTLTGCATKIQVSQGEVEQIPLAVKDFTVVDTIFLTSTAVLNENLDIIEGSEVTFEMLMKEAKKLGADDIANLRVDEVLFYENRPNPVTTSGGSSTITRRVITYTATALAIKYKD